MTEIAIVGLGNSILTDEGLGVHFIEHLRRDCVFLPRVDLLTGWCGGLNLYFLLESYQVVIFVDAVDISYGKPGSVHVICGDELMAASGCSADAHSVSLRDVFALQSFIGDPNKNFLLLGMVPASLEYGLGLSAVVKANLPLLSEKLTHCLRDFKVEVKKYA